MGGWECLALVSSGHCMIDTGRPCVTTSKILECDCQVLGGESVG